MAELPIIAADEELSEEEDEQILAHQVAAPPAQALLGKLAPAGAEASYEFTVASEQIKVDPWNVDAWLQYVQEAEAGRSGSTSLVDAYRSFLAQFPGATRYWHRLALLHFNRGEMAAVDEVLKQCLTWSADVHLWLLYVRKVEHAAFTHEQGYRIMPHHDLYLKARHQVVEAFEFAIDNVGMAIDADVLWSAYIKFISDWPDTDSGKVVALRKAFQRAVTVPCDGLDALWADYEAFERRTSEQLAANIIPDFQPRYQAAKAVYRDRKRLYAAVDLEKLATPPTNSRSELRQLHAWKSLLQAEQRNPSVLSDNEFKATMRHTFLLAVRCMRYHPEIWIYYAEHEINSGDTNAARVVLKNAVEVLPDSGMIRQFYAEFEERLDNLTGAENILRSFFHSFPSAISFNMLERFLWRTAGKVAARKFFSSTLQLRKSGQLSYHVYIMHGLLELEANREPEVALRVFELACLNNPECRSDPTFINAHGRVLVQLGKFDDLRAMYEAAIEHAPAKVGLKLIDELIDLEAQLLMSNPRRTDELLQRRKRMFAESERKPAARDNTLVQIDPFESTRIRSRYWQALHIPPQTEPDTKLFERITVAEAPAEELISEPPAGGRGAERPGSDLPSSMRDLLHRLPAYQGPPPDVDSLLKQLRIMPLPPRPIPPGTLATHRKRAADAHDLRGPSGGRDSDDEDFVQDTYTDIFRERQAAQQMQRGVEAYLRS